ncbi:hypothetical protein BYT27DRAFT_7261760 [Phlegmacium glaucopus]|nr:hypothetical protein BYT27DRAFT_7261760 [Phlegmacium glaucopus]
MSTSMDGTDSNVNVSRCQAGSASCHGSPTPHIAHHTASPPRCIAHHTPPASYIASPLALHDHFDCFSLTSASPRHNAFASPSRQKPIARRLFTNPSEGPGEPEVSTTTWETTSLTHFLENHNITHLSSTLDVIRRNLPISLWATELEQVGVSSTLIDRLIISMVSAARSAASRKRQEDIDDAVREWKASTLTLATDLACRFNKKQRYFLDLFFQSGVHLVCKQTKVNPHNAFLSMKAQELRDNGETPTLSVLHSEAFKEEYDKLDEAERAEIVAAHEVNDTDRKRPTAQARVQDVTATLQTIRHLLKGLNVHVGIEAFFCRCP